MCPLEKLHHQYMSENVYQVNSYHHYDKSRSHPKYHWNPTHGTVEEHRFVPEDDHLRSFLCLARKPITGEKQKCYIYPMNNAVAFTTKPKIREAQRVRA